MGPPQIRVLCSCARCSASVPCVFSTLCSVPCVTGCGFSPLCAQCPVTDVTSRQAPALPGSDVLLNDDADVSNLAETRLHLLLLNSLSRTGSSDGREKISIFKGFLKLGFPSTMGRVYCAKLGLVPLLRVAHTLGWSDFSLIQGFPTMNLTWPAEPRLLKAFDEISLKFSQHYCPLQPKYSSDPVQI